MNVCVNSYVKHVDTLNNVNSYVKHVDTLNNVNSYVKHVDTLNNVNSYVKHEDTCCSLMNRIELCYIEYDHSVNGKFCQVGCLELCVEK